MIDAKTYTYAGGGYWREDGVPKGEPGEILHAEAYVALARQQERERCAKVIDAAGFLDVGLDANSNHVERPAGDLIRALKD